MGKGKGRATTPDTFALTTYVVDTSALVALERDRGRMIRFLSEVKKQEGSLRTSAAALAEFLGGAPRERRAAAAWVSSALEIDPVDEDRARRAAALRQRAVDASPLADPSAIDALLASEAEHQEGVLVIDADRMDFSALAAASGAFTFAALADL